MDFVTQWFLATKRHVFTTGFVASIVIAATVCVVLFFPRTYRSRAQLLLRVGHENMTVDPTAEAAGQMVQMQLTRKNDIQTALEVMSSRGLLAEVVDRVGVALILDGDLGEGAPEPRFPFLDGFRRRIGSLLSSIDPISDRERAIRELAGSLGVSSASEASVISAQYNADTPEAARRILEGWVDCYLSKHADLHRTTGSLEFFLQEEESIRERLDKINEQLRDAKTESGLVTVEGQQKLLEGQLAEVRKTLLAAQTQLSGSQARAEALQKTIERTDDRTVIDEVSGKANEARDLMRGQLFELEVLEREYAAKYKSDHPRLVAIRSQLDEAKRIVDDQNDGRQEVTSGLNPSYQRYQQELALELAAQQQHEKEVASLELQRGQLQTEIENLNSSEASIAALERQALILEEQYVEHSRRLDQARIDEALRERRITSVNLIQPASFEERPVTPDKRLTALFGILALLGAVVGLPLVLESRKSNESNSRTVAVLNRPKIDEASEAMLHPMFFDPEDRKAQESS
ncbi:MAG: hypothetical protein AAF802_06585 [Planctomycetota bacterium]